ncbi:glycerophosphodiester phosphodiesterase [Kutzneria sp. 744]|uniref:glycerophosphodiester phosphodiesterase n=1 Tax=Kutzneria sp. (strain 744) TaxID=345341 RepID=UPI0005BE0903|nr:glycerophosphodiester phosphodiesterase [Kutzneria sp. 744]
MSRTRIAGIVLAAAAAVAITAIPAANAVPQSPEYGASYGPTVIGHRGASGYRPEHTLASYELAARMGADYVEPDLVSTKDGVLVARHEPEIGGTTDVAQHPEFASRKTTKMLDGVPLTGWFTTDFTLAELKTLRAVERLPQVRQRNTVYDGRYQIPTFQEVIDLVKRLDKELHRDIGIYPETKHPTFFKAEGLPTDQKLVDALNRNGLNRPGAKVYVQSFEVSNLKWLHRQLRVPLIQLTAVEGRPYDFTVAGDKRTYADITSAAGMREIATYAQGVGPDKNEIIPWDATGHLGRQTSFVKDAHAARLKVHPYTFRPENVFLPADFRSSADPTAYGNLFGEIETYLRAGIDGFFTDTADIGIVARDEFLKG